MQPSAFRHNRPQIYLIFSENETISELFSIFALPDMVRIRSYFSILLASAALLTLPETRLSAASMTDSTSVAINVKSIILKAESLRLDYGFQAAIDTLEWAKKHCTDSLENISIEEALLQAQNGLSMQSYCSTPVVVAKQAFTLKDFFLFYPLQDESWRKVPNQLDSVGGNLFNTAMYLPDGLDEYYFSAKDGEGINNIYRTALQDTVWSAPELLNEQLTSSSDEIFPMLSPDGKQLFFASKGLYGMGGYDLYVSTWDENLEDWGMPENMGFPYSSPYDDFLYMNTADGKYTIFASNRECSKDSVYIYVLEFDSMPVRKVIGDTGELKDLMKLSPKVEQSRMDNNSIVGGEVQENEEVRYYSKKMLEVRALRDSIYAYGKSLDAARSRLTTLSDEGRSDLVSEIMAKETLIPIMQDSLAKASAQLQKIELSFLKHGIVLDPEKIQQEADREVVGAGSAYAFSKKSMGNPLNIKILKPKTKFDYTLQNLPEGRFAEDNTIPGGIVYQIQLFSLSRDKASVSQLKGLSPVFERIADNGKRIYSAGLFKTYKDVLANLNKVKKAGFRNAFIVAYANGKQVTPTKARALEKTIRQLYQIRIFPADGNVLQTSELEQIRLVTSSDIARVAEGGVISYIIGPYDSKTEADSINGMLKAAGITNLRIEQAGETALVY